MSRTRGFGGADLVKMWLAGIVGAVALGVASQQSAELSSTTAGMVIGAFIEGFAPILTVLAIAYGAILLIATLVYAVRRARG